MAPKQPTLSATNVTFVSTIKLLSELTARPDQSHSRIAQPKNGTA